jgi:hypothetical protein
MCCCIVNSRQCWCCIIRSKKFWCCVMDSKALLVLNWSISGCSSAIWSNLSHSWCCIPFLALLGPWVPFQILLVFHGTVTGTAGTAFYSPENCIGSIRLTRNCSFRNVSYITYYIQHYFICRPSDSTAWLTAWKYKVVKSSCPFSGHLGPFLGNISELLQPLQGSRSAFEGWYGVYRIIYYLTWSQKRRIRV